MVYKHVIIVITTQKKFCINPFGPHTTDTHPKIRATFPDINVNYSQQTCSYIRFEYIHLNSFWVVCEQTYITQSTLMLLSMRMIFLMVEKEIKESWTYQFKSKNYIYILKNADNVLEVLNRYDCFWIDKHQV